jgi:hypothetical protein
MFQSHPGRRLAAALATVTAGLLAVFAGVPAAFASQVPLAATHQAAASGLNAWQIALTIIGPTAVVAVATVVTTRVLRRRSARRATTSLAL